MFLRDVLNRRHDRTIDAAHDGDGVARRCDAKLSLLEELAVDPEDFADVARALKLDLRAVVAVLLTDHPQTADELVAHLATHAAAPASAAESPVSPNAAAPAWTRVAIDSRSSWGSGEEVGWGRWTRARGGARVHRERAEREPGTAVRPAMAAS